jgi:hypothetical protein
MGTKPGTRTATLPASEIFLHPPKVMEHLAAESSRPIMRSAHHGEPELFLQFLFLFFRK